MPNRPCPTEADRAARNFYNQPSDLFAKQIAQICRNDERLITLFLRTRDQYLGETRAQRADA